MIHEDIERLRFITEMRVQQKKVLKYCLHMQNAGRHDEASSCARDFIKEVAMILVTREKRNFLSLLSILYDVACQTGEERYALGVLEIASEKIQMIASKGSWSPLPVNDSTPLYQKAGLLAQRLPNGLEDAYRYFWLACEAVSPPGCEMPALAKEKADVHACAKSISDEMVKIDRRSADEWSKRSVWHDFKMRELDPTRDWDAAKARNAGYGWPLHEGVRS